MDKKYIDFKLKTSLAYFVLNMRNKDAFLTEFERDNGHTVESASEIIARGNTEFWHLNNELGKYNFEVDAKKLPTLYPGSQLREGEDKRLLNGYKLGHKVVNRGVDLTYEEISYLGDFYIDLDYITAAILISRQNLSELIQKELKRGRTEITVSL